MREGKTTKDLSSSLSIRKLNQTKKYALRRRIWFKALNCIERGTVDLTIRYVDSVKSAKLAKVLTAIIKKLQVTTERMVDKLVRTIGLPLAQKISRIAINWGNRLASMWADDPDFARFLALNFAKK